MIWQHFLLLFPSGNPHLLSWSLLDNCNNIPLHTMAGNPCYSLLWLILLIFIAWPLAYFFAGLWIFLMVRPTCMGVGGGNAMCSFFMYIDSSDCRLKIYLSIQYIDLIPYLFRSLVLSFSVRFLYNLYNNQYTGLWRMPSCLQGLYSLFGKIRYMASWLWSSYHEVRIELSSTLIQEGIERLNKPNDDISE